MSKTKEYNAVEIKIVQTKPRQSRTITQKNKEKYSKTKEGETITRKKR